MYNYHIILAFDFPFNTEAYRAAPELELREAQWILKTFPFEEPAYLMQNPDEGPAPHVLFINQDRDYYLFISYEGESRYSITLGKGKGIHHSLQDLGAREVQEAISLFWDSAVLFEDLWPKIKQVYKKYSIF